jgi:hypothetical protein
LNIYDTITIDLGLLTATGFSITNSSYDFEIEFSDTYSNITIAVSTSDTVFQYLPSSEHTISYNGPETGTIVSETGTISSLTILSEQSYYLWGKVIDNLGFSSSYVYLNESDKIIIYAPETIYMLNNISDRLVLLWTNRFGYRTPYETIYVHEPTNDPEKSSKLIFTRHGFERIAYLFSYIVLPIHLYIGIDLVREMTTLSESGERYNYTNLVQYFTEENVIYPHGRYAYLVVLNSGRIDIYKDGIFILPDGQLALRLSYKTPVTVHAD